MGKNATAFLARLARVSIPSRHKPCAVCVLPADLRAVVDQELTTMRVPRRLLADQLAAHLNQPMTESILSNHKHRHMAMRGGA